ncbi:MAG: TRAP transporter substrate-binding protein DctP [Pseudooceanicola nanhaiensis]|uniref:TRAP transporter substrate-binding protein DctP n=1 Tax=Pseudooceanicola nanhaiensis TaxID=375761 RepID=UPI0040592408
MPQITAKYASVLPKGNAISDVDEYFAKRLEDLSGGKFKAEIYWTRALGKADEMLTLIEAGAIDFTMLETGQYSETQFAGVTNALPMVFFDAGQVVDTAKKVLATDAVQKELSMIGGRVQLVRPSPGYYLLCKEPIRTLSDFKGKKLRTYGAYVPLMWEALGAVPVNVASNELYEALDKGIIDCAYLPPSFLAAFKLHEVAKNLIDYSFGMIELAPIVTPTAVWDSWSPEVQAIVRQAASEAETWGMEHIQQNAADSVQTMISGGAQLVAIEDPQAVADAIPDMIDIWVKKQEGAGKGAEAAEVASVIRAATGS